MKKLEQRVPNLRFKGFTDDWEQHKLGDISTRVLRKNKDLQSTLPLTISAQDGLVDQTTFFHKQVASKQLSNYILLFKGEFAYNKSYSEGYPFGAIKRLNKYSKGVLSTLYIVFKPKNVNSDFLEHYYDTSKWYREIYRNAAEGARNHGLLNISAKDFFGTMLYIPQKNEQALIANVSDHLDCLISLQQRKLELLKHLKKGFLQKMFAEKNSKQPILRFKGFHDDWEQCKGSELFKAKSDKGYPYLPVLSATQDQGMILRDKTGIDIKYKKASLDNYKRIEPGDFIIHLRSFQGGFAYSNIEGIASPAYTVFSFKKPDEYNDNFWKEKFSSYDFIQLLKKVTYGVRDGRSISYSDFLALKEQFPDLQEQNKIGKALSKVDKLITLQQQKLAKYQSIKKSLLQQMFI